MGNYRMFNSSTLKRKPIIEKKILKEIEKLEKQIGTQRDKMNLLSYTIEEKKEFTRCFILASYSILKSKFGDDFLKKTEIITDIIDKKGILCEFLKNK